jgi:transposase
MSSAPELPRDVETLTALLLAERARVAERDSKINALEHKLYVWSKWLWGPRTEKRVQEPVLPAGQSWLPFADLLDAVQRVADRHGVHGSLTVEAPKTEQPAKARAKRRSEFPEHLPRVRTTIEVAETDRICCGKPMEPMGFELANELERIELAVVHEIARTKYCCRTCQMQVLTAPGPTRPLSKALLGSNWLAHLAVERFGNHMPYHRLEKKYESEGLALSRTVLCRSMIELAEGGLQLVHAALGVEVAESDVCFADETSAKVQDSIAGGPKKVWVWLYANKDGDCFYDYNESRGRDSPTRVLANFKGSLHDDGYCVYESALDPARVKHVACWAHVRRKFVDAQDQDPTFAKEAIAWIAKLYAIDSQAKERELSVEELGAVRREHAPAILAGFREWLDVRQTQVLPQSAIGGAIRYALGRWEALGRFLEDGRLELDNNRAERALRAVAVGRKNWMQIGNERGGKTAAVFYSLIGTCKARGIDPKVYLHDAMLRLAEGADPKTLTPREWQTRHGTEVAARRSYVLAQIVGQLAART